MSSFNYVGITFRSAEMNHLYWRSRQDGEGKIEIRSAFGESEVTTLKIFDMRISDGLHENVPITCAVSKKLVNDLLLSITAYEALLANVRLHSQGTEFQSNDCYVTNQEDDELTLVNEEDVTIGKESFMTIAEKTEQKQRQLSEPEEVKSNFILLQQEDEPLKKYYERGSRRENSSEIDQGILMHTGQVCREDVQQVVLPYCKREALKIEFAINGDIKPKDICVQTVEKETNKSLSPENNCNELEDEFLVSWSFGINELYALSTKFLNEKEGKAFHLTYKDKLSLLAYNQQVTHGKFITEKYLPVGYLDVFGKDWKQTLGDLSQREAKAGYVNLLDIVCNLFRPFVMAHKCDLKEKERKIKEGMRKSEEEEERLMLEDKEKERLEEENRLHEEKEKQKQYQQKRVVIQEASNKQTFQQFKTYAEKKFPGDPEQQAVLVHQLQEQLSSLSTSHRREVQMFQVPQDKGLQPTRENLSEPSEEELGDPVPVYTTHMWTWKDINKSVEAFLRLKEELIKMPSLHTPDLDRPFQLKTDASATAIGACLAQNDDKGKELPIAFFSKKLTPCQIKWSTIEREAFCVLEALKKFDTWVSGAQVQIVSDHNPLSYLTNSAPRGAKLSRWALALQRYNMTVTYRKGSQRGNADALSRLPIDSYT